MYCRFHQNNLEFRWWYCKWTFIPSLDFGSSSKIF